MLMTITNQLWNLKMSEGQFTKGYDERRNLEGRPKGSKNYKTVLSNFIGTTINYNNPLTDSKIECTPIEAMFTHLLYLGLVKDNTTAMKILLDKVNEYENPKLETKTKYGIDYSDWTDEELIAEIDRIDRLTKEADEENARKLELEVNNNS